MERGNVERPAGQGPLVLVDGGGTGARLRAVSASGAPLGEGRGGPASLTLGVESCWASIEAALAQVFGADVPAGTRLFCGLAGGRSPERQAEFRARDPIGCAEIVIVTDGFATLLGAHGGRPGVILAVGTGVTAYALSATGAVSSTTGWGFAIGDEGSGAWIGRRALAALTRRLDGRAPAHSRLHADLAATVGAGFDAIQLWLADAGATAFAGLAPLVVVAAGQGDAEAEAILAAAARELDLALAALPGDGPIALLGGLAPVFAPRLAAPHRARLVAPEGGPLDGLARMAAHGWRSECVPPARAARP